MRRMARGRTDTGIVLNELNAARASAIGCDNVERAIPTAVAADGGRDEIVMIACSTRGCGSDVGPSWTTTRHGSATVLQARCWEDARAGTRVAARTSLRTHGSTPVAQRARRDTRDTASSSAVGGFTAASPWAANTPWRRPMLTVGAVMACDGCGRVDAPLKSLHG